MKDEKRPTRHDSFPFCFVVILALHALWEIQNDTPPTWDMAHHQLQGWDHLKAWKNGQLFESFPKLTSYYPPLYYLQEAFILCFFSKIQFLPLLSNLAGLFLLAYCSYGIAFVYLEPAVAALAGTVPLLFPLVAWTSRESLLDVPLSGWVSVGVYLVLRSELFQWKSWTLLFGIVIAAGMLTKWTFVLFLLFPVLYALTYSPNRRRSVRNLVDASILALPVILWWYLPNLNHLLVRFKMTAQAGIIEGDPALTSLLAWIYYPRSLSSYYLYLPLSVLLIYGLFSCRGGSRTAPAFKGPPVSFLLWWFFGSLLVLTILRAKDPRYIMPLVPAVAIVMLYPFRQRPRLAALVYVFAFIQFLSVSFQNPLAEKKIALFRIKNDTDYRSMRQEWVLYQSNYFQVTGPPRREDWHYEDILKALPDGATVAFVPDLASFHPSALHLYAVRGGKELTVIRAGQSETSVEEIARTAFVVGKSGFQGISYISRFNHDIYRKLEELNWPRIGAWNLPDQSQAFLWHNPTPSR